VSPDLGAPRPDPDAELIRLRSEAAFHQRLRDLMMTFSRGVSSTLTLGTALQTLAFDANALLGAERTSIWLYQRRARELTLACSSDGVQAAAAGQVTSDQSASPAARGLRLDRPLLINEGAHPTLLIPLRGWRRALGTLVVDGPLSGELSTTQLLGLTHELGRQVSAAVENIQLLEEVLHQRRQLEDTFNSIVDLVVVTDSGLRVIQMNDVFLSRVGLSRAEVLERPLETLVGAELSAWASSLELTGPGPDIPDGARTRRFDDSRLGGTFIVTMTSLKSEAGDFAGYVLVARDITHQTRLEHEREALRERLAQSQKLAALGQFVAGIAHEMNNPLQGVLGHLELMMETVEAARPLRRELRRIYQEADRAAKIVRNLLAFTGSRRLARRRVSLGRVLGRALSSRADALAREGIEVVRSEPADLPPVAGDPLLLHQALLNVLINAEHAIAASERGGGRIEIHSHFDAPSGRVIVRVRDTGAGIPPDVLPRIFDPFFTTKDVGKGTGLGLAITYGIIQDHGGTIEAANAPDVGAMFTIALPVAA
jgi:two-component system NtrC family sensor kinase